MKTNKGKQMQEAYTIADKDVANRQHKEDAEMLKQIISDLASSKGLFISEPHLNGNGDEVQIVISEKQYSWPLLVMNTFGEIRYGNINNLTNTNTDH